MSKLGIWVQLEAKPGKEKELETFLKSAQPLAEAEPATLTWYAIKLGPGKYGIFDTFADENGRNAHLSGEIAKALFAKADELLAKPPEVAKPEVLAAKGPAR
jgi:quinol monooxygenase YgiN